jgi:RsiW-degrading membrane proteinase PrsW (M82 family)
MLMLINRLIIILLLIIFSINNSNKQLLATEEQYKQSQNSNLNLDFQNIRKEVDKDFEYKNEIIDKRRTLLIEHIDHEIWKIKFIERSFEWQFASSFFLFFMVIIIVSIGLWFSYIQFTKSLKKDNQDSENQDIKETTIRIGQGEIEISSSVIGLIILTLSFAFFYLYITNVFPLQELGLTKVQQEQTEVKTENKTEDKQ